MRGGLKEMARLGAERAPPAWLRQLLGTRFFEPCPEHPAVTAIRSTRSVGCNYFCTNCAGGALCSGCLAGHEGRRVQGDLFSDACSAQIRKSSSHGLVRVADIERLLNVSLVQTYLVNGEEAVFLDKREISGKGRAGTTRCEECSRGLQDLASLFCSLGCKAKVIEDGLDFSISFAVDQRRQLQKEQVSDPAGGGIKGLQAGSRNLRTRSKESCSLADGDRNRRAVEETSSKRASPLAQLK
uniref:B box-type domain-containing protein n=1 Tax=Setaria viridis TaxID=4556 RepID=A0A4U6W7B2_SETVI|nr:hypothetical protein SEVIR_1G052300v2 [Setaria viridis]